MHLGRCSELLPPKPTLGLAVSPGSNGQSARSQPPAHRRPAARLSRRPIGRDQKPGWGVTYIARVRIRLGSQASGGDIPAAGGQRRWPWQQLAEAMGYDVDLGLAHESALKEAETDAI